MIVSFILAIVSYMLIDNVVLSRFYGICSFIGVGNKVKSAFSMGLAVTFVIMMATLVCYPLYFYVLVPAGIPFLDTLVYILVIASLVQIVGLFIKKTSPSLYKTLGIYLPLITTNCAVLGVVQTNSDSQLDFLTSLANGLGTSIGFLVVIVLFACMRERMNGYNIPKAMKGVPIALIVAALMAMAFMGFGGMVG
ncbi:MAG: RnfABCDGE type electron transport complex subunit A [Bacilli bacterium]|nr:RnfABCDGE type electron transport complex subunit A [Bacilli bacterium]MBR6226411.1 RnfABCDGE type electron transport complex subunit A [Bacilli bacterium]